MPLSRLVIWVAVLSLVGYDILAAAFKISTISEQIRVVDRESNGLFRWLMVGLWLHLLGQHGLKVDDMAKKWIQKAIKHPGALHRELGVPQGKKIPESKIAAAAKKGGKLGKRARFAETLKGFHKHAPAKHMSAGWHDHFHKVMG